MTHSSQSCLLLGTLLRIALMLGLSPLTLRAAEAVRGDSQGGGVAGETQARAAVDQQLDDDPQLKALADQMRQQLKPFLAAELSLANTLCRPNAAQLRQMKALAPPALEQALLAIARQQAPQRDFVRGDPRAGDPLEAFQQAASRIVARVFPAETVARFHREQQRRKDFHALAGAAALVAHLDNQFRLTASQRKALTVSLRREWQGVWQTYLPVMESHPRIFPPVPDQAIVPHLDTIQVQQWRARPLHQLGFHWQNLSSHRFFPNTELEIDWFEKPPARAEQFEFLDLFEGVDVILDAIDFRADEDPKQ